jgi:hypothetical protein
MFSPLPGFAIFARKGGIFFCALLGGYNMSIFSRTYKRICADYHAALFELSNDDAHYRKASALACDAAVEALQTKAAKARKPVETEVALGGLFYDPRFLINVLPELEPKIVDLKDFCERKKIQYSLSYIGPRDCGQYGFRCLKLSAEFTPPDRPCVRIKGAILEAFPIAL